MKKKMLAWANRSGIFCFLDNQDYSIQPHRYDCLLAVGVKNFVSAGKISDIDHFLVHNPGWVFGHLGYDLKNEIHGLSSSKKNLVGFPDFFFFQPQSLLRINGDELFIEADDATEVYNEIIQCTDVVTAKPGVKLKQKLSHDAYIEKIAQLQKHILRGDCYEINFCNEFYACPATIDPVSVFFQLISLSPNPFSALYKLDDKFLVCASPERYLMKKKDIILSQPMKGTIRRDVFNEEHDNQLKNELEASAKDQSENVMVTDMVRNDLSQICVRSSVHVNELFGIYTYPHVHQMISTISGKLEHGTMFSEILKATFPMGSMTGAPKLRVMELIEQNEVSSRGIFSGAVGYFDPDGDFDFNVVIRSIMYNATEKYLSYQVGSGITFYSDPEKEWDECLLKGEAMKKVLGY
jgi:para-aminobenzoate synthetase component 1